MPRTIGFFIFPDFQLLDLTGPLAAFQLAGLVVSPAPYRWQILSLRGGPVRSTAGLEIATVAAGNRTLDTLVVSGGRGTRPAKAAAAPAAALRSLARRTRRVTSVCTGAFLLAEARLLDGRRATTHWRYAANLQREFPRVKVESDRIFVKDGSVWTSAGITAGIDLALALIEEDLGIDVSRAVARELVVYHRRSGGQSQFSALLELEPESDRIRRALAFARDHLAEPLSVERLAAAAGIGPRQFSRAFRAETGETPARAIERLRTEAARLRVEAETGPIEQIAAAAGFADPERMRRAFVRRFGQPPQALRRAARTTAEKQRA
jgi:transcriptional regulator GlxA family with amidase domain